MVLPPLNHFIDKNLPKRLAYFELGLERDVSDEEEDSPEG